MIAACDSTILQIIIFQYYIFFKNGYASQHSHIALYQYTNIIK